MGTFHKIKQEASIDRMAKLQSLSVRGLTSGGYNLFMSINLYIVKL